MLVARPARQEAVDSTIHQSSEVFIQFSNVVSNPLTSMRQRRGLFDTRVVACAESLLTRTALLLLPAKSRVVFVLDPLLSHVMSNDY